MREMTAEEREWLRSALRPAPATARPYGPRTVVVPAVGVAVCSILAIALAATGVEGTPVLAGVIGLWAIFFAIRLVRAYPAYVRARDWHRGYDARMHTEITEALEDGHAVVKRVRAVAVIEVEPMEDEGTGFFFDLGDGRTLFVKGQDFDGPMDEEDSWPNSDFEIVRTRTGGRWLDLRCHGERLRPLRVVRGDECDPEKAWDEREEVLDVGLEDAVKTILAARRRPARPLPG